MRPPALPPALCSWTLSDGYELHGRIWKPTTGRPRGVVLYLHGIQSHGAWFEWSAARLALTGCVVLLPDRRGSGLNRAARGDVPRAERWLADLDELADWTAREFGLERFGVVGVSWGGKPAAWWALRRPERVAQLLLITPGLFPAVDVGLWQRAKIAASLVFCPAKEFPIPLNDPALFTDNPSGQAFIANDPLKLTRATARFLYQSARLDRILRRARPGSLRPETSLWLAGRERIIRNSPTIAWLTRIAAQPAHTDIQATAAHTLEFEPDVEELGERLVVWGNSLNFP